MSQELTLLDQAIKHNRVAEIQAFFEAADQVACNELLLEAGTRYRFHTEIVEGTPGHGWRVMLARDLARVMYGNPDTGPLGQLLKRYAMEPLTMRGFDYHTQILLRTQFGLNKFDGKSLFCTWNHFVLVAMHGQTPQAQTERQRLLSDHRAWRIARTVEENTGHSPRQLAQGAILDQYPEYRAIADLAAAAAQNRAIAERAQAEADSARQEAQAADAKVDMVMREMSWLTLRQYVYMEQLDRQLPERLQRDYGRWLTGYCHEHGIPMYNDNPADRSWHAEHKYYIGAIRDTLPGWLRRNFTQLRMEDGRGGLGAQPPPA